MPPDDSPQSYGEQRDPPASSAGRIPQWGQPGPTGGGEGTPVRRLLWEVSDDPPRPPDAAAPAAAAPASHPGPPQTAAGTAPRPWTAPPPPPPAGGTSWLTRPAWIAIAVVVGLTLLTIVGVTAGRRNSPGGTPPVAATGGGGGLGLPGTDTNSTDTNSTDTGSTDTGQPVPTDVDTAIPEQSPTADGAESLPDGYTPVSGPGGVRVPIPSSWSVHAGAVATNLQADDPGRPGRFVRFGADAMSSGDALATIQSYERDTPTIRKGYQRLRLESVSFGPTGTAVDWEFTFSKDGRSRHAYGRYWYEDGLLYVVYLSAWSVDWPDSQDILTVVLNGAGATGLRPSGASAARGRQSSGTAPVARPLSHANARCRGGFPRTGRG
jgi:hypothetical protein